MRAAFVPRYGSPDVIRITERPAPSPGPNDVVVEVHASAVTQGDRRLRAAHFPAIVWLPGLLFSGVRGPRRAVPGATFAGRVVAVGETVTNWKIGDAVFGESLHGAHAERVCIRADGAMAGIPAGLSMDEAACLPYGAHTAHVFVQKLLGVLPGARVLVIGTGGVGRQAARLARHLGASVTLLTTRRNAAYAVQLGANAVVVAGDADAALDGPFDAVLDTSDTARFADWKPRLSPAGRFASTDLSLGILLAAARTARSSGQRAVFGAAMCTQDGLREVAELASTGAFDLRVASTFGLDGLADAHRALERERPFGEVIVHPQL